MTKTPITLFLFTVFVASAQLPADENEWFIRLDEPPPAASSQNKTVDPVSPVDGSIAEVFPVPPTIEERTTETKKPPEPDYLISKVIWGEAATFTGSSGNKLPIADWNMVDNDIERLTGKAREIGQSYRWSNVNLNTFSYDPRKTPSIVFSGVRTLKLDRKQVERLRNYVLNGGMIIIDSIYGSPYFYDSAKALFEGAFPEDDPTLRQNVKPKVSSTTAVAALSFIVLGTAVAIKMNQKP